MPVTFYPSDKKLTCVDAEYLERVSAKEPLPFLTAVIRPELTENIKNFFQSSFKDLGKAGQHPIIPASNGFVQGAIEAYNTHHHLVIRPDDVWITILTQLNLYINAHAEELRHQFVSHEGKKELLVVGVGSMYTAPFGKMAEVMTQLIQKNVLDPELRTWIIPDFSTTTENDRIVSSIVMMATLKAYFDYKFSLICGLPAVTLLGEKQDWMRILEKIEKLPSFGKEPSQWYTLLKPVLAHFVAAFDQPESKGNKDFWQKIAHREGGGSGPTHLSGWITAFTFFSDKGQSLYQSLDGTLLDGVQFHRIDSGDVPQAYAEVNVDVDGVKTIMVAGVVGYSVSDSGMKELAVDQVGKQDTLQPVSGWWMFEEKGAPVQSGE